MTFDNDFEQMLNDYDIQVSDRTRRLIRRNRSKLGVKNSDIKKVMGESATLCVVKMIWRFVHFILSIIFGLILGIGTVVIWVGLFAVKLAFELWCFMLIVHITQTVIRQYQLH
jgi:hypothetical protein